METLKVVPPPPRCPEEYIVLQSMEDLHDGKIVWLSETPLQEFGIYISYIRDGDNYYGEPSTVDIDLIKKKSSEVYEMELKTYQQAINERAEIIRQNENIQKRNDKLRQKEEEAQAADLEFQEYLRLKEKFGE